MSREYGVRVVSVDRTLSLYHLNRGEIRHRKQGGWTIQRTTPGFWDSAADKTEGYARLQLARGLNDIAKKIHP